MDIDYAIRIIQSNERGRQGVHRIDQIRAIIKKTEKEKRAREIAKNKGIKGAGQVD